MEKTWQELNREAMQLLVDTSIPVEQKFIALNEKLEERDAQGLKDLEELKRTNPEEFQRLLDLWKAAK